MSGNNILHAVGKEEYVRLRAAFVRKGSSVAKWCDENGYHQSNVRAAFLGNWKGPKADQLKAKISIAAGVSE